jgi:YbgC/YbaW family acyl-CoA thioester hydrolase
MHQHPLQRKDYRLAHRLRVRWAEVDMQKIVFNGHYLMYFDTAMADYWRALAVPYEQAMHQMGGDLYVKKASVEYFASAKYDDSLDVCLKCTRLGNSSLAFTGGIFSGGKLLVSGELIYVYANPTTQTSQPIPAALRSVFENYEAGHAMTRLAVGNWQTLGADARVVRTEVFVNELGISQQDERDANDASAVHAVVYNQLNMPLATGRLLAGEQGGASGTSEIGASKIGRMATLRVLRSAKLGDQVLGALVQQARQRGDTQVLVHAQLAAAGFYERAGFVAQGTPYDEVGIPHVTMALSL